MKSEICYTCSLHKITLVDMKLCLSVQWRLTDRLINQVPSTSMSTSHFSFGIYLLEKVQSLLATAKQGTKECALSLLLGLLQ